MLKLPTLNPKSLTEVLKEPTLNPKSLNDVLKEVKFGIPDKDVEITPNCVYT